MDNPENQNQTSPASLQGVVTARECDCCGHHEVGIILDSGEYVALRPGMRVAIIQP